MHPNRVVTGAVLLAVVGGVLGLVGNLILPPPPTAPAFAWYLGPAVGVLTLAGLALWWWRGSRAALWTVVVVNAVTAVLPVLDLSSMAAPLATAVVVALVVTVVAIALVAPALHGPRSARVTGAA
ncbi:hypothetical protein GCM10009613_46850 [Pseudonocardia kongjuensis]|uniref:Uncharacterized protein n=1 Tax=Pseudonocardia kongjuensis TaxID=102227 RepID=A0ABP4ITD9_9PSEU